MGGTYIYSETLSQPHLTGGLGWRSGHWVDMVANAFDPTIWVAIADGSKISQVYIASSRLSLAA